MEQQIRDSRVGMDILILVVLVLLVVVVTLHYTKANTSLKGMLKSALCKSHFWSINVALPMLIERENKHNTVH